MKTHANMTKTLLTETLTFKLIKQTKQKSLFLKIKVIFFISIMTMQTKMLPAYPPPPHTHTPITFIPIYLHISINAQLNIFSSVALFVQLLIFFDLVLIKQKLLSRIITLQKKIWVLIHIGLVVLDPVTQF